MRCPNCFSKSRVIRKGVFAQGGNRQRRQRYRCHRCGRNFSEFTGTIFYRQRRPDLEAPIFYALTSGLSQRRCARNCHTTQTTVARKLVRLSEFAEAHQLQRLKLIPAVRVAIFDEMETFEHTKCKPVSIAIAVEKKSRLILATAAVSMPAKGLLAKIARKRYPPRKDERRKAMRLVLSTVAAVGAPDLHLMSDKCPRYPKEIRRWVPRATHKAYKGRRGCIVGQGELKAGGFDPLFSLNHTCAMVRDNIKRLSRKTWCTTKRIDRLQCLLNLYTCYHNEWIGMPSYSDKRKIQDEFSHRLKWGYPKQDRQVLSLLPANQNFCLDQMPEDSGKEC